MTLKIVHLKVQYFENPNFGIVLFNTVKSEFNSSIFRNCQFLKSNLEASYFMECEFRETKFSKSNLDLILVGNVKFWKSTKWPESQKSSDFKKLLKDLTAISSDGIKILKRTELSL